MRKLQLGLLVAVSGSHHWGEEGLSSGGDWVDLEQRRCNMIKCGGLEYYDQCGYVWHITFQDHHESHSKSDTHKSVSLTTF